MALDIALGRTDVTAHQQFGQLAVTVVREGVVFKEGGQPVHLLVTLAATDPNGHIEAMKTLAMMFADPENIQAVIDAEDTDRIYELFTRDI